MRWVMIAALTCCGGVARAADGEVEARPAQRPAPFVGVLADAGVPDGANAALVLRPASWVRLHGGGGTNSVSGGLRGGFSLIPFGVGPSLSLEVGRYWDGEASGFVRRLTGVDQYAWASTLFKRLGYTYGNAQLGLELGSRTFTFFLHAGVSYIRARVHDAQDAVDASRSQRSIARGTTVTLKEEPYLRVIAPSAKLGIVVYVP